MRVLSAVLALFTGNGTQNAARPYPARANPGRPQPRARAPMPSLQADFEIACECGRNFTASVIGLSRRSPPVCPACGKAAVIDGAAFARLTAEFTLAIQKGFEDKGYRKPTKAQIEHLRRHGAFPADF